MTADERAVLKSKLLHDFLFFTRWFFKKQYGSKFVVSEHHEAIAAALVKVVTGETRRLVINLPPRYGKTELAVKMFVAWCLANNPRAKFIHLSYADSLALDNSSAIRELIQSAEFQAIFPLKIKADSNSKQKWYTDQSGGLYATAAGGQVTGFGAGTVEAFKQGTGSPCDGFGGAIIIDDPLKPDDALSDTRRNRINSRYNETIASRVNSRETPIIVIMQRLHEDDMSGYLLGGGSGEDWEHLVLPAIKDDGTALWPAKHTIEELEQMQQANRYVFAGQYMQRPSPLGGGLIKGQWFLEYRVPPKIRWRAIYVDTAQKTKERNDYSVFECWGLGEDGNLYLLDLLRGKWEAPDLERQAKAFWAKHKADRSSALRRMLVEDKASGTGLIQSIARAGRIPIKGIQRTTDKLTRLMDVQAYIESGRCYLPADATWLSDFLTECEAFTSDDSHKHDDQIDPMIDAINDMLSGSDPGRRFAALAS